jgi:AcrR family transcriptional regulator
MEAISGSRKRRRYDSTRRKEQARQTRADILDAARRLFIENGYAATTLTSIADAAGVSVDTIYGAYEGKSNLFRTLIRVSVRGDEDPTPLQEREVIRAIVAEPDPRRKIEMYAEMIAAVNPRHAPLVAALREAARSDTELTAIWERQKTDRLEGMAAFAAHLAAEGALRDSVSEAEARDALWTLNSTEVHDLLVGERGWSPDHYGAWVAEQMIAALLEPAKRRSS